MTKKKNYIIEIIRKEEKVEGEVRDGVIVNV